MAGSSARRLERDPGPSAPTGHRLRLGDDPGPERREVTSVPAAMAVFVLVRRTVFAWYIGLGLAGSLLTGYAYQAFLGL